MSRLPTLPVRSAGFIALVAAFFGVIASEAANVTWVGGTSSAWETGTNWDNAIGPALADTALINSGAVIFSTGATSNLNALRFLGGTLTFSGGTFTCTNNSASDSQVNGTLNHTRTVATINELEIGGTTGTTGIYNVSGGSLKISRGINGYSLYLGANKSAVTAGTGTLEISGGGFSTRSGVKLGDSALGGTGKFSVLGSVISEISIATLAGDTDGTEGPHGGVHAGCEGEGPESRIEVRQDSVTGTVLGSVAVPETRGAQTWETIEASLAGVTGTHSIYLKFVENGSSTGTPLCALNWMSLILPPTPTSLAASPSTSTQATLSWAASAGATGYELLRSATSGGPYTTIATGLTANTFTNTGLTAGTSYYYVVRALYGDVSSTTSPEVRTTPSAPIDPKDVIIASAVIGSDGAGGTKLTLTIARSGLGHFYQGQSSQTLASGSWINASNIVMGNGGQLQIEVPISAGAQRSFYRVNVWRE